MPNKFTLMCCVPGCNKDRSDMNILHKFPDPVKDADRFRIWLYAAGRDILGLSNDVIFKYRRICHIHFLDRYHTANKFLTKNAVPTLHLSVFVELLSNKSVNMTLPKIIARQRDMQLKVTLKELQESVTLCKQLLQERKHSAKKLKKADYFQTPVDSFAQCAFTHKVALKQSLKSQSVLSEELVLFRKELSAMQE